MYHENTKMYKLEKSTEKVFIYVSTNTVQISHMCIFPLLFYVLIQEYAIAKRNKQKQNKSTQYAHIVHLNHKDEYTMDKSCHISAQEIKKIPILFLLILYYLPFYKYMPFRMNRSPSLNDALSYNVVENDPMVLKMVNARSLSGQVLGDNFSFTNSC